MEADSDRQSARRLTLLDLDNTLIAGDSDYGWAQFLIETGVVDRDAYEQRNAGFFADYHAGTLDIHAFLEFQLKPMADNDYARLLAWRERFVSEKIVPMLLPAAKALVDQRLAEGDLVAVVTATNSFITRPIADLYGISHLVATGKLTRVRDWLQSMDRDLGEFVESWFYSDSHNDLPLLSSVTHPVAVDPDPRLLEHASARGWPVMSWRSERK